MGNEKIIKKIRAQHREYLGSVKARKADRGVKATPEFMAGLVEGEKVKIHAPVSDNSALRIGVTQSVTR